MLYTCLNYNFITSNIKKNYYKIQQQNSINNLKCYHCFGSLLKIYNKYYLFITTNKDDFNTHPITIKCLSSIDGIIFYSEQTINNINLKAICNNFIITYINNTYLLIGGRHCGKIIQEKHNNNNCNCKNTNYHPRIYPPFKLDQDNQFYNNGKGTLPFINDNFLHKCFMNGIYCFTSSNMNNWKLLIEKPIISGLDEGINDSVFGATTFDSQNTIIFDDITQMYYFYCRNNIKKNGRFIQYSTSTDLINWNPFKNIINKTFDFESDNYYSPNFFKYPNSNFYIGLITSRNLSKNKSYLSLLTSSNLIEWQNISNILDFNGSNHYLLFDKNIAYNGMCLSPDNTEFYFYLIHNFESGGLWFRYSIRKDGFISLQNDNNLKEGIIKLNELVKINNIILNYKTFNNGYIILELTENDSILYTTKLIGNNTNYAITIPIELHNKYLLLTMKLYNSEFYSIDI